MPAGILAAIISRKGPKLKSPAEIEYYISKSLITTRKRSLKMWNNFLPASMRSKELLPAHTGLTLLCLTFAKLKKILCF